MKNRRVGLARAVCLALGVVLSMGGATGCGPDNGGPGDVRGGAGGDASPPARTESPAADTGASPDVPYVGTPQPVVEKMLALAGTSGDDVVYDLGSGDGRIPITAAQQFGARAVGVEIREDLVRIARNRARLAGVGDRVSFRRQDLFEVRLDEATVVTLFLLPEVNRKLRPRLLRRLDPGDRVVSHRFDMGAWAPDSVVQARGNPLYLWRIPADAAALLNRLESDSTGSSPPAEDVPAEDVPAEDVPAEDVPAGSAPVKDSLAGGSPVEDPLAGRNGSRRPPR
jgi:hypothetical protein